MHQNLLAYGLCCLIHFCYRDNKRVCNESISDNLCKTKWRPNGHFCGNRYQGRADIDALKEDNGGPGNEVGGSVFNSSIRIENSIALRPRSHYSVFVRIRFCCIKDTVHNAPFSYKNGEKNLRFCAFTLICPITKRSEKHPFLCVDIDQMRFEN